MQSWLRHKQTNLQKHNHYLKIYFYVDRFFNNFISYGKNYQVVFNAIGQEMHVLAGQEQQECVGGANSTLDIFRDLSKERLGLDFIPQFGNLLSTQIGESKDFLCGALSTRFEAASEEENNLFSCISTENIPHPESINSSSGYVGSGCTGSGCVEIDDIGSDTDKQDGIKTYYLGEAVVIGKKKNNTANLWGGLALPYNDDTNNRPSLYPKGSIGNPYTFYEYNSLTEKKGYYYNEQGILSHGVISRPLNSRLSFVIQ